MRYIPSDVKHPKSAYFLAISNMFERAAFYGLRAIILLYLVDEVIQMSRGDAMDIYGMFFTATVVFGLVGSVVGDLVFGNRKASQIGIIVSVIACMILMVPHINAIYVGLGLFTLGAGLYRYNVLALLGKTYLDRQELTFGGFTWIYAFINVGAALGIITVGLLYELHFIYAVLLTILYFALAFLALWIGRLTNNTSIRKPNHPKFVKVSGVKWLVFAVLFSGLFWVCYELLSILWRSELGQVYQAGNDTGFSSLILENLISGGVGMGLLFIIAGVWSFVYSNSFMKLFLGLLILSLGAFALLYLKDTGMFQIVLVAVLLAVGEGMVLALLDTLLVKYMNPKYLAIGMTVVLLPKLLFYPRDEQLTKLSVEMTSEDTLLFLGASLVIAAIIVYILHLKESKVEKISFLSAEAQAFLDDVKD